MPWSEADRNRIESKFDSFCKTVLKNYARDWYRAKRRKSNNEVLFSELPEDIWIEPVHIDQIKFLDRYDFHDLGFTVSIENDALAQALSTLSKRKRQIILLSYFFGMTDQQIGDRLHAVRSTIQAARTKALREMRELLEKQK